MSRVENVFDQLAAVTGAPADVIVEERLLPGPSERELLEVARLVLTARVRRHKHFPAGLFRESAWEMLLELFISRHEGRQICVKDLVSVSGEPSTTALRKIDQLQSLNLISRKQAPEDNRRVDVRLTERGENAMIAFLQDIHRPR